MLADGRDALYQGQSEPYDLIILDLGLPGLPGLDVLKQWRVQGLTTPVLILTARGSWSERIEGLKAGADDYVTKPFHPEELQLRVQALLRRAHGQANQPLLKSAGLQLDEARQCVVNDGAQVQLTAAEFRLCDISCCIRSRFFQKAIWLSISMTVRPSGTPMCWRSM